MADQKHVQPHDLSQLGLHCDRPADYFAIRDDDAEKHVYRLWDQSDRRLVGICYQLERLGKNLSDLYLQRDISERFLELAFDLLSNRLMGDTLVKAIDIDVVRDNLRSALRVYVHLQVDNQSPFVLIVVRMPAWAQIVPEPPPPYRPELLPDQALENSHTFVMTRSTVRLVDSMTVASNTNLILEDGKTPEGMFTGTEIQILYAQSVFRTEPCIWNYYEDDSSLKNINYPQSVLWDHLEFAVAGPLRLTPADGVQVAIGTHLKFCHKKGGGLFEEDECYSTMERAVENLCKAQNLTWFQARQSFFDPATYSLILAWFNRHEQVPEMDCNVLPETIVSNQ